MLKTDFEFTLPMGYLDAQGNLHRQGIMRLSRAKDEIEPMEDARVRANPAYATVLILERVITHLGTLETIDAEVIENLFTGDLNYLQEFYRRINGLLKNLPEEDRSLPIPEENTNLAASTAVHEPALQTNEQP